MPRRAGLPLPLALAALLAASLPAAAQEAPPPPAEPAPAPVPAPSDAAPAPAPEATPTVDPEAQVEVKGNRFSVKLKVGSVIEGVLPRGVFWEKQDRFGDYVAAKETDKGAGLRLHYVLNLEGELFIKRADIAAREDAGGVLALRDLGALTEEQKAAIRDRILAQRRKVIEDREKAVKAELDRLSKEEEARKKKEEKAAEEKPGKPEGGEAAATAEDEEIRKGDALLAKFPPPEWSEQRIKDIENREVVQGVFRNDQEREFIDGFRLWKAAYDRKQKAEEGKEGGSGEAPPAEGGK